MRKISMALATGLLLITATEALQAAPVRRPGPLVVRRRAMNPTKLAGNGGNVFVRVQASKRGATVSLVRAQGSVTGSGNGSIVALTQKGAFWEGNVPVPRNSKRVPNTATIMVYVTTNLGVEERVLGKLKMLAGDDSYPPPPPSK